MDSDGLDMSMNELEAAFVSFLINGMVMRPPKQPSDVCENRLSSRNNTFENQGRRASRL